uniref:Ferritin n=1 Tax=Varanus komodoensis TaxID=61221 RepID=A0A8D2JIW8_VARKO
MLYVACISHASSNSAAECRKGLGEEAWPRSEVAGECHLGRLNRACEVSIAREAAAIKGEIFDQFDTALPNVSKFFLDRSKEEREAAEALIQYQHDRGGIYCTRVIQKPPNVSINGVATALEVALVQWKTLASYFEELYALSIKNSDPHTASTIKKQFLAPKIERIKLMGDLITNTHRLRSAQDGKSNLENYLIDRLQEELKLSPDSEGHRSLCVPLRKGRAAVEKLQLVQEIFPQHNNNVKPKCPGLHCFPSQPRWKGLREADRRQEHKWY